VFQFLKFRSGLGGLGVRKGLGRTVNRLCLRCEEINKQIIESINICRLTRCMLIASIRYA